MNDPKVSQLLKKIHPDIRSMSLDEGRDFILWLIHRNIDLRKLLSYSFDKQVDLLLRFRKNSINKEYSHES